MGSRALKLAFMTIAVGIQPLQDAIGSPTYWQGLYVARDRPKEHGKTSTPAEQACVKEIFSAQDKYGIPNNLLLAIGIQEAGRKVEGVVTVWPWSVNANGEGSYHGTDVDAIDWTKELKNAGKRSIDVGCMQINLRWHPQAFADLNAAFNPKANVDYAARFLKSLFLETADWRKAAGRYHSRDSVKQNSYLQRLDENQNYVRANINNFLFFENSSESAASPTVFWSAFLSDNSQKKSRSYSIYSSTQLQPVIPFFTTKDRD